MSNTRQAARYTEYHPRWYRTRVSTWWWLARWPYLKFILREISSVFVAWFVVVLLLQIRALSHGPDAYARFEHWLQNPGDRKSTRLNSSHTVISYAVFCLK